MATAQTVIYNLALAHLGVTRGVASLTEQTKERKICEMFYDASIKETLRAFDWPFATKFATLGLIDTDPTEEWAYSYQYPSDCLKVRRILSGDRNDTRQSRVSYKRATIEDVQVILTDKEEAELEYTIMPNIEQWPDDFCMAASLILAGYIAPGITGADPGRLGQRALGMAQMKNVKAEINSANEEQVDEEPESELTRARE